MKTVWIWFVLSCKRYGKKIPFLLFLFLLPAGAFLLGKMEQEGEQKIYIALAVEGKEENDLGMELALDLVKEESAGGMFRFYLCEDREMVEEEVAARNAECGYVIYDGLRQKMDQKKFRRSIGLYYAPSTVAASLSSETVFAALARIYNRDLLVDYVEQEALFEPLGEVGSEARIEAGDKAGMLYDHWISNGSTFHFSYYFQDQGEAIRELEETGTQIFPIRGIAAALIFSACLYGVVAVCQDEERGLFQPLPYGKRKFCCLAAAAAPGALAALSGLAAVWAGGEGLGLLAEWTAMFLYLTGTMTWVWILKILCRKGTVLNCLISLLTVGSLAFCPVFVDVSRLVPALGVIGRFLPPWYYLQLFR